LNGLPTANTHSPIAKSSLLPSAIAFKPVSSILITAISVAGSAPTTVAVYFELSFSVTFYFTCIFNYMIVCYDVTLRGYDDS
jgi:hypothetical protein